MLEQLGVSFEAEEAEHKLDREQLSTAEILAAWLRADLNNNAKPTTLCFQVVNAVGTATDSAAGLGTTQILSSESNECATHTL